MKPRTVKIGDTLIVLERVRGARVDPKFGELGPGDAHTLVWLEDMPGPISVDGDHLETIRNAIDGDVSRLVLVESPYAGDVERNLAYGDAAMRDALLRGEYPFASHLLYTRKGILDDNKPEERRLGIEAGLAWGAHAARSVVYTDLGISDGMRIGIDRARSQGREVVTRQLADGWGER
jgi:hypothetical protein